MKVRHFYHVYAAGAWVAPVTEHVTALGQAGLDCPVTVGLVGPRADRDRAREGITFLFSREGLPAPDVWAEADTGWEQVTLQQVHLHVHQHPGEFAVLYAHTKGAWASSLLSDTWRWSMTRHVIGGWRACVRLLEDGYDTAGCHWLAYGLVPGVSRPPDRIVTTPVYAGNFWWARASYLRHLPPPGTGHRHEAEEWIGLGAPRAYDLLPGWPSIALFISPEAEEDWQQRVIRVRGPAAEFTCAHADGTCAGLMRWVSVSREYLGLGDFMPLCQSHRTRYRNQLVPG